MQKLIFFAVTLLFLAACNNAPKGHLNLNNGEKWTVNIEMRPFIEQGNQLLNDYIAQKSVDHKKLAAELKAKNDNLVESCTMSGESHDQLHKWLHPHMELVEKLGETSDPKVAESIVAQLEHSFLTYQNYFQ